MLAVYGIHLNISISNKSKVCSAMLLGLSQEIITKATMVTLQIWSFHLAESCWNIEKPDI